MRNREEENKSNRTDHAKSDMKIRSKRLASPFDIVGLGFNIIGLGFDIYGIIKGLEDDKKLGENFNKVFDGLNRNYRAIEKNYNAIQNVEKRIDRVMAENFLFYLDTKATLTELRLELQAGFKSVLSGISELKVADKVSSLTTFIADFMKSAACLRQFPLSARVVELERPGGSLEKLRDAIKSDGILHGNLHHILNQGLASPKDFSDLLALSTLDVLYFGVQTYVSVFFFMVEQYAYLAEHHYQAGDIKKANEYFDELLLTCAEFKNSLLGASGLLQKVDDVLRNVSELPFVRKLMQERMKALETEMKILENFKPAVVVEQPEMILHRPDFSESKIPTPIGKWKQGAKVSYAIQYRDDNGHTFSKFGEWSTPTVVGNKANPYLRIPLNIRAGSRLIFRKFENEKPELVGRLEDKYQNDFHDISRDLFDAALRLNDDAETLLEHGADINAAFEKGRNALHAAASCGNVEFAEKFVIKANATDINARDAEGYTPLHISAERDYADFVNLLVRSGADVNAKTTTTAETPLHIAAIKGHKRVVEELLRSAAIELNAKDKEHFTPLHVAVFGGVQVVRALMANVKIDVNAASKAHMTPLHLAAISNYADAAEELVTNSNVDVNARTEGNFTALHFAAMSGYLNVVNLLATRMELDSNAKCVGDWTALHFATAIGSEEIVSALLKMKGIDANARAATDITPLHLAAKTGGKLVLLALLENDAIAVDAQTTRGFTALHIASMEGNVEILTELVKKGAKMESKTINGLTPLLVAVSTDNVSGSALDYLLTHGADTNATNKRGETFEWLAASKGNLDAVEYVVERRNGLEIRDTEGNSLLHHAAKSGNLPVVRYLIEQKQLNVNSENAAHASPLYQAICAGDTDMIGYIMSSGGKVMPDQTPLHCAVVNGALHVIQYLLEQQRVNINAINKQSETPLLSALRTNNEEVVEYLVQHGANLSIADAKGNSPLHYAVRYSSAEVLNSLIASGGKVNSKNAAGELPLHKAASSGNLEAVQSLVNAEASTINARDNEGNTPLALASKTSKFDVVEFLVRCGADVQTRNKYDDTPLHSAAANGNLDIVKYLVGNGASINARNGLEMTPIHEAAASGRTEALRYLVECGGINSNTLRLYKEQALHDAARGGHLGTVKYLVEELRVNVEAKDSLNNTTLCVAAWNRRLNVVKYLIGTRHANKNARDRFSRGLLHAAAVSGNLELVRYLVEEQNFDVNSRDSHGATPLTAARLSTKRDVVRYLESRLHARKRRGTVPSEFSAAVPHSFEEFITHGLTFSHGELTGNGNDIVPQLSNGSQQSSQRLEFSFGIENGALLGCLAEALNESTSRRYSALRRRGVNVVPSNQIAVNSARRKFDKFVVRKIKHMSADKQREIRGRIGTAGDEINASLMRGVEWSGLLGLERVLGMCEKCFCENFLKKF